MAGYLKKAFCKSDQAFQSGAPQDQCLEELCKAIDTAKTLQRSLQNKPPSTKNNAIAFIDFIHEEIPRLDNNDLRLDLVHARSGEPKTYKFGQLVYEIRCMIHKNENLNKEEKPDFHILLDWKSQDGRAWIWIDGGRAVISGLFLWGRLRKFLAKFITLVDSIDAFPETGRVGASINPLLGACRT